MTTPLPKDRPVLIVGAGALGLRLSVFFGALNPTLVVRRGGSARVLVSEEDPTGAQLKQVEIITEPLSRLRDVPEQAVIIICTKVHELAELLGALSSHIRPTQTLVLAQNGIGVFDLGAQQIDPQQIVRLSARFGATKISPWSIIPSGPVKVSLAARQQDSTHLAYLRSLFTSLSGEVELSSCVEDCEWQKALLNLLTNTVATVLDSANGIIAEEPELWQTAMELASEFSKVAASASIHLGDYASEEGLRAAVNAVGSNINSTLADLRAGRRSELPWLIDPVVKVADANGVAIPVTKTIRAILKVVERRALLKR